jgi:hypothetical protein
MAVIKNVSPHRAICISEVWPEKAKPFKPNLKLEKTTPCTHFEENIAEVSTQAFDGIIQKTDMDALAVSDIAAAGLDMT